MNRKESVKAEEEAFDLVKALKDSSEEDEDEDGCDCKREECQSKCSRRKRTSCE